MTTCTRARALLFLQRSTFLNTVNLIIIGCNGIRNQMFLDTCIVQAERNVTIEKTMQNAVSVQRDDEVVGHLMKGKSGRFGKKIFYFLRADKKNDCTVVVTGKAINRGDGEGMQVPCTLNFKGHRKWIDILKKELVGKD